MWPGLRSSDMHDQQIVGKLGIFPSFCETSRVRLQVVMLQCKLADASALLLPGQQLCSQTYLHKPAVPPCSTALKGCPPPLNHCTAMELLANHGGKWVQPLRTTIGTASAQLRPIRGSLLYQCRRLGPLKLSSLNGCTKETQMTSSLNDSRMGHQKLEIWSR